MVGQHVGNYKVVRQLGKGGMGEVFEAVHIQLGRKAAIKVLHAQFSEKPDIVKRFFNEARAACIINHPGIVDILEYGHLPGGAAFIVMEFLDGDSLSRRLKNHGKLGLSGLPLIHQMAATLAVAHGKGIIHRDLKPDNIMIVADPMVPGGERIKIVDFGIAKLAAEYLTEEGHVSTATDAIMGTPAYMSPEQCQGAGSVDDKADVYSLGAILFHVFIGRPPFSAGGLGQLLMMQIATPAPSVLDIDPSIPLGVAQLINRMLAKLPTIRPTMAQVAAELQRMAAVPVEPLHASGRDRVVGPDVVGLAGGGVQPPGGLSPDRAVDLRPRRTGRETAGQTTAPFPTKLVVVALVLGALWMWGAYRIEQEKHQEHSQFKPQE